MGTPYEADIVAWAREQAALLRAGDFPAIDALHIAEEIESVANTERRELKHRMSILVANLLKWNFQPSHRGKSWSATVRVRRREIHDALDKMPSLRHCFDDERWLTMIWDNAVNFAEAETDLDHFPSTWSWSLDQVLSDDFWPD
ncbi:MAG: DUF29 domain-containing protein [Massilia sp.]